MQASGLLESLAAAAQTASPAPAREGALVAIQELCQALGQAIEPFAVTAVLPAILERYGDKVCGVEMHKTAMTCPCFCSYPICMLQNILLAIVAVCSTLQSLFAHNAVCILVIVTDRRGTFSQAVSSCCLSQFGSSLLVRSSFSVLTGRLWCRPQVSGQQQRRQARLLVLSSLPRPSAALCCPSF